LANVNQAVTSTHIQLVASMPVEPDASDAGKAANTIYAYKPNAVLLITAGKSSLEFVRTYNKLDRGTLYCMLSVMGTQETVRALEGNRFGIVVSQVMPFPYSATTSIVMQYQSILKKKGINAYSFASMEGFLSAAAFAEGIRRAGKNPTRESLIAGLESMHDYNLGDFYISFAPGKHLGSQYVDLTAMTRDGRFIR
jgi:branched-chain amino acid transport system substrate-binding protein